MLRNAPRRTAVRRRWQFAHTTSHFAISSRMAYQFRRDSADPMLNALSRR